MRGHRSRTSFLALALLIGAAGVSASRHSVHVDPERGNAASFANYLDLAPAVPAESVAPHWTMGARRTAEPGVGGARGGFFDRDDPAWIGSAEEVRRPTYRAYHPGPSGARLLGLATSPANAPPNGS